MKLLKIITKLHKGRLGRARGFLAGILNCLLFVLILFSLVFIFGADSETSDLQVLIIAIVYIVSTYIGISLGIRRLHDIGKSGKYILFCFVPVLGFFYSLYIIFKKGNADTNIYGLAQKDKPSIVRDILNLDMG